MNQSTGVYTFPQHLNDNVVPVGDHSNDFPEQARTCPQAPGGIYDAEAHYLDFVDSHLIVRDVVM